MKIRSLILVTLALLGASACRDVAGPGLDDVGSIRLSADSVRLLAPGDSARLSVIVADAGGAVLSDVPVEWSSSDTTVATISDRGVLVAVGYGSAEVRASALQRSASVGVKVGEVGVTSWSVARPGAVTGAGLADVWSDSQGNVFAVGRAGTVIRSDGGGWSTLDTGTSEDLWKISGSSSSNLYVISGSGHDKILHFDGSRWTTVYDAGTRGILTSVWVAPSGEVFAVGYEAKDAYYRALFVHWNGKTWEESYIDLSPSYLVLNDVWGSSSSDVYAVGGYASGGIIFHFDGTSWTRLEGVPTIEAFDAVGGSGPDDVWAAGAESLIVHFDGGDWSRVESPTRIFAGSVWSTSASDAYISGYSSTAGATIVLHYDGARLTQLPTLPHVFGMAVAGAARSPSESYVVSNNGTVLRLSGGSWTTLQYGPRLVDIAGTGSGLIAAVGASGAVFVRNGTDWPLVDSPPIAWDLASLEPRPEGDLLVLAASGSRYRFDGKVWTMVREVFGSGVVSSWTTPSGSVFSTVASYVYPFRDIPGGWRRSILELNGSGGDRVVWSSELTSKEASIQRIDGLSDSEAYAVGSGGLIVRFDGSSWTPVASGTDRDLFGVGGVPGAFFVVGDGGLILRLEDGRWSPMESGTTATLRAVWGSSVSNVYAVGDDGTLLRFDGARWSSMPSGTDARLNAVWGENGSVFVAGDRGVILTGQ